MSVTFTTATYRELTPPGRPMRSVVAAQVTETGRLAVTTTEHDTETAIRMAIQFGAQRGRLVIYRRSHPPTAEKSRRRLESAGPMTDSTDMTTTTGYTIQAAGSGERGIRGSRDAWQGHNTNIAVRDGAGRIVAWYERRKAYRSVEVRAEFLNPETGRMSATYTTPAGYRNLRAWFLAEAVRRYGVSL